MLSIKNETKTNRNCLVGKGLQIKICDFGTDSDIYGLDYYRSEDQTLGLPVRWMAWESVIQVYQISTWNNPKCFGVSISVQKKYNGLPANFSLTFWNGLIPGEIYDQKWRVVVCRHSVGDFGSRSTASLSRIQWRDRRRKSAAFRTRDNFQRPAVCFFVETAALPSRYLRPDVRMLAATAHRTSFFPWNSSFPPAQEPWLFSHCLESCLTESIKRFCIF